MWWRYSISCAHIYAKLEYISLKFCHRNILICLIWLLALAHLHVSFSLKAVAISCLNHKGLSVTFKNGHIGYSFSWLISAEYTWLITISTYIFWNQLLHNLLFTTKSFSSFCLNKDCLYILLIVFYCQCVLSLNVAYVVKQAALASVSNSNML